MNRRIVLAPWGSFGDVHPFLAVGLGLKHRGHTVIVATGNSYRSAVEGEGLGFLAVRPDVPPQLPGVFDPKRALEVLVRQVLLTHLKSSYDDLLVASRSADLIIGHMLSFAVPVVAHQLRVPWLTMVLQPMALFSKYDPPLLPSVPWLYTLRKLGTLPYSILFALRKAQVRRWGEPIDNLRGELGLPLSLGSPLHDSWRSPFGTLVAFSREFAREQPDWPKPSWITGFACYDAGPAVSLELGDFLRKGEPPIVFTLGDAASRVPGNFYQLSLDTVRRLGCRAVFLTGLHIKTSLPEFPREQVFVAEYAPYSQVFPHAAAVVHAGGIGTIALALRACCPMLLVPLGFDQADNAERARRIGVARVVDFLHYSCDRACQELRELLSNPTYARQASLIGSRVNAEDGVATACERIESILAAQA